MDGEVIIIFSFLHGEGLWVCVCKCAFSEIASVASVRVTKGYIKKIIVTWYRWRNHWRV